MKLMSPATLTALKGTSQKWHMIAIGREKDRSPHDCPLCELFWGIDPTLQRASCSPECPVYAHTGRMYCKGTPYEKWDALGITHVDEHDDAPRLAEEMEQFLDSLIPDEQFLDSLILPEVES